MVFPHGFKGLSSLSDQFSDEESSDEEGAVLRMDKVAIDEDELAIASLGVSNAIVEALAKRGITQLFPIQVFRHLEMRFAILNGFCPLCSSIGS